MEASRLSLLAASVGESPSSFLSSRSLTHGFMSGNKRVSATSIYFESMGYHVDVSCMVLILIPCWYHVVLSCVIQLAPNWPH